MKSVLDTCTPRPEILAGTFNPEVFTASLAPIVEYYRWGSSIIDSIYTNAELFFREATYPTQGLKTTLAEVFGRIAGAMNVPAIHRLETSFGGGKTHTLIACTHIANRGRALSGITDEILDPALLPEPGSVAVVGVAGEEIPVHKPKGDALVPYTLWGEIAYQIGGDELYRAVEDEANSHAAPGKTYFDRVFSGRKVLIMMDELAQYTARLEAARPDGASQLAAFLMSLNGYARNHPGMAIVVTLASAADAFARQTERLAELISQVRGEDVAPDDAIILGEKAVKGVASVVARDAVQITPVLHQEISSVLAKRLFSHIDYYAAAEASDEYLQMYRRNSNLLPEESISDNFRGRMTATYPFHPTLVSFLNNKLASAENFQGTRGVLRVLALAVRSLWQKRLPAPMIHACHIDLRSDRVVNEILGRTKSSDLLFVLNADIGSVDTGLLEGGLSNAELADQHNPHPEGHPFYEYTWKTVFLHSLVGREEGVHSKIFGLTESEALFDVSFPGLTPPQVRAALEEINESAFYLRYEQGKYFASEEPTINSILARIRKTLKTEQVEELLAATARKVITKGQGFFHIEHDVSLPEHLPDGKGGPVLGIISLMAGSVDALAMVTTKGVNKPREQQNLIFILAPETVTVQNAGEIEAFFQNHAQEVRQEIDGIARHVKAMRLLADKPEYYGVNPRRLDETDFKKRKAERENALVIRLSGIYSSLYYPSTAGYIMKKEIKTAGGEGGLPFIQVIKETLKKDGEILTSENTTQADLINLNKLFFEQNDIVSLAKLRQNFCNVRSWPVLESFGVFDQIIRAGVQKDIWCVYRLGDEDSAKPAEFYHQQKEIPLGLNLSDESYGLIEKQGAKQRGWTETDGPNPAKVREGVIDAVAQDRQAKVQQVQEGLKGKFGTLTPADVNDAIAHLVREHKLVAVRCDQVLRENPDLIYGPIAAMYNPQPDDVLVTPEEAEKRGWYVVGPKKFRLSGREGAAKLLPLLRRLGSLYNKGASSTIENLDLVDLELPEGGKFRLQLSNVPPASMKRLGELFEVLVGQVKAGEDTEVDLDIADPDDNCLLIRELKKAGEA